VRRGCLSLGEVQCDECHRIIPYGGRYLIISGGEETISRLCVDCCLRRNYAGYKVEKGQQVLTFFVEQERT
jgi:hypothetical protein